MDHHSFLPRQLDLGAGIPKRGANAISNDNLVIQSRENMRFRA